MEHATRNSPPSGGRLEASEDLLRDVLARMRQGDEQGLEAAEQALGAHPDDARLHFLRGSILAGLQRYAEARQAMQTSVNLAPGFAIARFQLGLLVLCGGDAIGAETAWGPLHLLPEGAPLRLFVEGLDAMIRDEFEPAIRRLRDGIARNQENEPLNRDMSMLIDAMQASLDNAADAPPQASGAQLLLQQYASKDKTR
ncbi:MAG TPA: hypothetical protein VG407_07095 [Caulobacteraceae bacterium]|jgi:tetratricopeptide (TPR) repeat protein|nr:hypothetical protein [Caulobacteraceae bacterium]